MSVMISSTRLKIYFQSAISGVAVLTIAKDARQIARRIINDNIDILYSSKYIAFAPTHLNICIELPMN